NDDAASIAEMDAVVRKFSDSTGWEPGRVVRFAGALVYSRYNWLLKRIMRSIVRKKENGRYTDMTRDYVFTDFDEVRKFAREFGDAVRIMSPRASASKKRWLLPATSNIVRCRMESQLAGWSAA